MSLPPGGIRAGSWDQRCRSPRLRCGIGTAIIYAVVFLGLLALSAYAGPARYSADYYLERRLSWWWRLAETRRPAPAAAPPDVTIPGGTPRSGSGHITDERHRAA